MVLNGSISVALPVLQYQKHINFIMKKKTPMELLNDVHRQNIITKRLMEMVPTGFVYLNLIRVQFVDDNHCLI